MPLSLLASSLAAVAPAPAPAMTRYAEVALDPAGTRIASVDSLQQKGAPAAGHGVLVVREVSGRIVGRYDPCPACRYADPAWSPDGDRLAFVASGGGTATLYVLERGQARRLASVRGLAADPRWSRDGRQLAFAATVDAAKETGATQPGVRQVGVIGEKDDSRRIAVVPAGGGAYRLVSPEGTFVYEYDWTPDARGFVGTAAEGNGDNQWWVASLRAFALDGGMRTIAAPAMQMNFPRVSPDGRQVAFIGGLMSDFGSVGGDVYTVPLAGGQPANATPGYKGTFTSLAWRGPRLVAGITLGGSTGVATVDPERRAVAVAGVAAETIAAGDGRVALDAAGGHAAYAAEGYDVPPRILFGALGRGQAVTHDNDALPRVAAMRDLRWRSGGAEVQGWLLSPRNAAAGKAPMVTVVHGGPAAAWTPRFVWGGENEALLARGYWLFMPNPRGSFGQGEAFTRANVKDFGGGDLQDILAGVDAAERQAPIDDARLGIYGHSYGGFMTMWAVTHTDRFKGAVAGAGLADWVAYYGQNGIDQWMIPYFGASAYDDPKTYDRLSPIRYIRKARTPTLLYVGERDVETPPAQSLEFWHGLRAMKLPTELVIYEDEGHGIRKPEHIADRERRMVDWFDRYLR